MQKDVYVISCNIVTIPASDLLKKKCSLDIEDKRLVEKGLQIVNGYSFYKKKFSLGVDMELLPGDIILFNGNKYLVYSLSESFIELFKLYGDKNYQISNMVELKIESENNYYYFYNCSVKYYRNKIKYKIKNRISREQIEKLCRYFDYYKEYFEGKNLTNVNLVGTIYDIDNEKFLYLFSLGNNSYGVNVKYIDSFNYKIDYKSLNKTKNLRCISNIQNYGYSWNKIDPNVINTLYKLKVTPFEPIEDLWRKFNTWHSI